MRRSIMACALFALAATPSWAETPSDPHHPAGVATPGEAPAATPTPQQDQAPARPDMMQLLMEHETHAIDHGEDHANCCKVKKPAQ